MSDCRDNLIVRLWIGGALILLMYISGYMIWYGNTPLGLFPALDGAQNLETARLLWNGMYEGGIFQRSPLYSIMLSWMYGAENATGISVLIMARLLNVFAVIASACMVGLTSSILWGSKRALVVGVALVGLNPVVLFFAGDPLDISMASCCMAVFLWVSVRAIKDGYIGWKDWLLGGLALGFGIALRPMFLFMGWFWPIYALIRSWKARHPVGSSKTFLLNGFLASIGVLGSYALNAWANLKWADELYFQQRGSGYTVWWGNGPESNGRFYTQRVELMDLEAWENPMIVESELVYAELSDKKEPYDEREMNRFFLREAARVVLGDPVRWVLLMAKKLHSLIHNHEQFDNKTYEFHKQISPWLRWNPIGWGLLLVFGVAGMWVLVRRKDENAWFLFIVFVLYSGVILATFTANRYRVPLVPLLAVLSSWVANPASNFGFGRRLGWLFPSFMCVLAVVVFAPFWGVKGDGSRDADYCLLARACHLSGDDVSAVRWADLALETMPCRNDIQGLRFVSRFNSWFFDEHASLSCEEISEELDRINHIEDRSPAAEFAFAIYEFKMGDTFRASERLLSISESHSLAREAFLTITNEREGVREQPWDRILSGCVDDFKIP